MPITGPANPKIRKTLSHNAKAKTTTNRMQRILPEDPTWSRWLHWHVRGMSLAVYPRPVDTRKCTDPWSRTRRSGRPSSPRRGPARNGMQIAALSCPRRRSRWWWSCPRRHWECEIPICSTLRRKLGLYARRVCSANHRCSTKFAQTHRKTLRKKTGINLQYTTQSINQSIESIKSNQSIDQSIN